MHLPTLILALALALFPPTTTAQEEDDDPSPSPSPSPTPLPLHPFANATIYQPTDPTILLTHARTESLPNNILLAAWSDPSLHSTISIYRSTNHGFSWYAWGNVTGGDARGKLLEPYLLYVEGFGGEDGEGEGVVLMGVKAEDETGSASHVDVYASWDAGESWEFGGRVASWGGGQGGGVGEPVLVSRGEGISVVYSDAGGAGAGAAGRIVQRVGERGLEEWGVESEVVGLRGRGDRVKAPSVVKLPNNRYMIAFSYGAFDSATQRYDDTVRFKVTTRLENASKDSARAIVVDTGVQLSGSPYVTWAPVGGKNGTIVLSDSSSNSIFINQALGEGVWREVKTTVGRAWAREVRVADNDSTKLRFAGGGELGQNFGSQILVSVIDLQKALKELGLGNT